MKNWIVLICLFLLWACSSDNSMSVRTFNAKAEEDSEHEGMIRILAENAFVVMGTKKEDSRANERPKMTARFDYNFSLGKSEVPYRDFNKYITDEWGFFTKSCIEDWPVTDVTFFDVVLYANARSKAEGFDTAYTYSKKYFDTDGHCNKMEGFTFHPEVDAYRVPTEAEWMLGASMSWDLDKAWLMENSENSLHPVCSAGETSNGLCDMAGNAMEWVNDWMGYFKDTVVFDFAGGPDGSSGGERVLKGGSYRTPRENTNVYSRNDVYTVTSSTRDNYVGFRLAFGRIPDAVWLNGESSVSKGRAVSKVLGSTIRSRTGTLQTKLAFRNDLTGNIAFVDYAITASTIYEIQDTLDCYHPDISPNGVYVAFSTGIEGTDMESSVYVRMLDVEGDSLVKLDMKNASIPRWRVDGEDTVIVFVVDAGNNKDESAFHSKSTWQVTYSNFKFGKPKKLFDGAYHGGISYDNRLAVTGSRLLRARVADSASTVMDDSAMDTVWYNGEQACNVSLALDSTKRTLFLDFGSDTGEEFVGKPYQVHERILVADSLGNLIQSVGAPEGYTFDHSEWATGGVAYSQFYERNFAVATLANSNGAHEKIVMVDFRDSSILELVEGTELWHPCLWSYTAAMPRGEIFENFDLDSAAIYFESDEDPLIASKMNMFWIKSGYIKVLGLGSSRMSLGFVSNDISYGATLNMAVIPSDMDVSYYLAKNYVFNHCKNLKYLVIGLDLDLWCDEVGVNVSKNINNIPGFAYDANHDFWADSGIATIKRLSSIYMNQVYALRRFSIKMGWVENEEKNSWSKGGSGKAFLVNDSTWSDNPATYETAMSELQEIIDIANEKGVTVLGVVFPQSPDYAETGAFGRHGLRRSHANKLLERLEKMTETNSNFFVMDENKMGNHDYPDSTALDFDHLNMYGGKILTSRIDSAITAIEKLKK